MSSVVRRGTVRFIPSPAGSRPLAILLVAILLLSSSGCAYIAAAADHFDAPRWFWYLSLSLVSKRAYQVLTRLEVGAASVVEHLLTIAEQNAVSIVRA